MMKDFKDKYDIKFLEKQIKKMEMEDEIKAGCDEWWEDFLTRRMVKFEVKVWGVDEEGYVEYELTEGINMGLFAWLVVIPFVVIVEDIEEAYEFIRSSKEKEVSQRRVHVRELL